MTQESKPLILIVEDEKELADLIAKQLEDSGMLTAVHNQASHAIRFLKRNYANLILLDLGLPDQDGFSLLNDLRENNIEVPTIFLTGNSSEVNKVKGLEMGGDDYITKPFSFPELVARIHAVLRRAETSGDNRVTKNASVSESPFPFCGATVNPLRMEIEFPDGDVHKIGRKELGILAFLYANQEVVLTRKSLIHSVWGIHADVRSRSLDQYIVKIRELFSQKGHSLDTFRTVHGVGYIYDPEGKNQENREQMRQS